MTTEEYKNLYNEGKEFQTQPLRDPGYYWIRSHRYDRPGKDAGPLVYDIARYYYEKGSGLWLFNVTDFNCRTGRHVRLDLREDQVLEVGPKIETPKDW